MNRSIVIVPLLLTGAFLRPAMATDVTLPQEGRVTVELISSEAAFSNTLSVVSPQVAAALSGCKLQPADGLSGVHVVSEKLSQRGCRVELDSDPATPGIQAFAQGTVLSFGFCAQTDADPQCEYVWSSNPAQNSDGFDHVHTEEISPGVFRLSWEDLPKDQTDSDFNDLIVVVRLSTDTDGDGLWDDWETLGVDTDGDGGIDLDLPALGADPMHKDIFVEIDWMDCALAGSDCAAGDQHSHRPKAAAIQAVVDAFANANVDNPDGTTGINLHVDVSNAIAHQRSLVIPNACFVAAVGTGFDAIKNDPANFGPTNPRRFTHHYSLWTHEQSLGYTYSGCGELPGNDFQISLGAWNYSCVGGTRNNDPCYPGGSYCTGGTCQADGDLDGDGTADEDVGTIQQQAGTFMHELGHNLALGHGGGDWTNNKPNYLSIMNYTFQVSGIPPTDPDGTGPLTARVDYSRQALATLVETTLSEPAGIGDGTDNTFFFCPGSTTLDGTGTGSGAIDWNCNGVSTDTVSRDLNADSTLPCVTAGANGVLDTVTAGDDTKVGAMIFEGNNRQCDTTAAGDDVQYRPVGPLGGYFDWVHLKYDFQNSADFEDGQHTFRPEELEELTFERFAVELEADPAITMQASPSPVLAGSDVTFAITVTNARPTAALNVIVQDVLPASLAFVSCASTGGGVCGGSGNSRTVSFASIPGGGSAVITIVATVDCAVADGTAIANTATLSATKDADLSNNGAKVFVTASNPPPTIGVVSVNPSTLWPPNHKLVETIVTYTVTDNCGPVASALSVASNEPVNGLGDGDTAPDWAVVDANRVQLRSERSGTSGGRVYTITVTSTDSAGGFSSKPVTVSVPKNP